MSQLQQELAEAPSWVVYRLKQAAIEEGLSLEEYMNEYNPSLDPRDWDNDPGSAEQAWA